MTLHLPFRLVAIGLVLAAVAGLARAETDAPLWNIAWITDTQTPQCEWITAMIEPVKANKPSMIIHTGDLRFEWANRCAWKDVLDLMRIATPPLELHVAPGNHDDEAEHVLKTFIAKAAVQGVYPLATDEKSVDEKGREHMVSHEVSGPEYPIWNPEILHAPNWQPGGKPPYRYVFRRGNIRFIICDVYYSLDTQLWLRDLITQPDDSSISIVLQHEHIIDGRNENYFKGLEGKHNVKLMLTGHDHHYHFEQRHGVTFITGAGMAEGQHRESDAMTLWVYRDHLRLDRYVIPEGAPRKPVHGPETIWTCDGRFTEYRRPDAASTQPAGRTGPNRFVIVSDLHPHPTAYEQVDTLVERLIAVQPAFIVVLGDIGGDGRETSAREMEKLRVGFRRLREAGIEIYPVMGNHDVHPRVEETKVKWFLENAPTPLNPLFDAKKRSAAYEAFEHHGPYNYSFNRGGIHFVVVDSNTIPPKGNLEPALEAARKARWEIQERWLRDDLCRHVNNPQPLPTLVFLHHPEYMTGDRGFVNRPLFRVLESCRDAQTVKAVFGGHWHYGQSFPAERNLGADVYAVPVSVHPESRPIEFIVGDVQDDQIVLTPYDVLTGQPRADPKPVHYRPIPGQFSNLRIHEPQCAR